MSLSRCPFGMIDIIVANWNCVSNLIDMVQSVRANTHGAWRMFVHDNASEDGAAEWLSGQDDLGVTLGTENDGFSRATNFGVERSLEMGDSEWTVLMNNDITVPRHWDKIMLRRLRKDPRVKVCSPALLKTRGRHGPDDHFKRAIRTHGRDAMVRADWVGFSCAFIHKDIWREHGLLEWRGHRWHWDSDREFCMRLDRRRHIVAIYTGLGVRHWHGASRRYVHRRRAGERASQGIVWRMADEMYAETGRIDRWLLRDQIVDAQGHAPSMEEISHILSLWLDRMRVATKRLAGPLP